MFINRDYTRTTEDDFKLNVQPKLDQFKEAIPVYVPNTLALICGWNIVRRYE